MITRISEKWNCLFGKPSVRIIFINGRCKLLSGKMRSTKLRDLASLLRDTNSPNAWIHFYSDSHSKPYRFSSTVPERAKQKIRNIL